YFSITVIREGDASFELEYVEKPEIVHPGEDFEITVRLRNMGFESAKSVLVEMNSPIEPTKEAILIDNTTNQHFTYVINSDKTVEYKFRLHASEDANTGSYPLTLKVSYFSGDSKEQKEQTFEFSIQIIKRNQAFIEIEDIDLEPSTIEPGDEFILRIKI
ncbi:NEW3 domain-containing protein, partial [Thermococcus sp. ES12]